MDKHIEIWTDGTTGGFNIAVNGHVTYYPSYEAAHAALVGMGMTPEQAAVALDNARHKAKK